MVRILRALLAFAVGLLVVTSTSSGTTAHATDPATYVSGGTIAARVNGGATVDEGYVVCDDGTGTGSGGFCVPFGGGNAVWIADAAAGEDVAFQVCVDNSGDGVCTSPDSGTCADVVVFSHDDGGAFYNPVGPLPTGFTTGCGSPNAYQGYVVFLCEGVHVVGADAHAHPATTGTGGVTTGGEGTGTFCGGNPAPSRKAYLHGDVALSGAAARMTLEVGCFGCGEYGPSGNTITWACQGVCLFDGEPCVACVATGSFTISSPTGASCVVSSSLTGTLTFPSGTRDFVMTLLGNVWTMTDDTGTTASGVVATRQPVGNPCGGPATLELVGVGAGA